MSAALAQAVAAEIRAESGRQRVSGRELARRIDEPVTTVSRWLRGDTALGLDDLDKIAAALEIDLVDLIRAARLQLMAKKLPRLDSNQQPAGRKELQVTGLAAYRERRRQQDRRRRAAPLRTHSGMPAASSLQLKAS